MMDQRKRKADGGFAIYKDQEAKRAPPTGAQSDEAAEAGRRTLREKASREASKKVARETLERLQRCNVPESVVSEHDVDDKDDPSACSEYVADMYKHFKELEVRS